MENYYRIMAYYPKENVSAIIDSYGKFDKVWKFSSMLVTKGLKVIAVGNTSKFDFGKIPAAKQDNKHIILRACGQGEPKQNGNIIEVNGFQYTVKQ